MDVTNEYYLYGCNGGVMDRTWSYQYNNGLMTDEEYPYYSGDTQTHGACQYDRSKAEDIIKGWGKVNGNVSEMVAALKIRPMAVAVSANNSAFMHYSSGIVTSAECNGGLDHAVTLVGYKAPHKEEESDDDDEETEVITETVCRLQRWKDMYYETGCRYSDETLTDDTYCCWTNTFIDAGDDDDNNDGGDGETYWKIQNSWGSGWGADGFIYLAVEEGAGACGVNQWIDIVTTV